ncbi:hypothetical protein HK097_000642 [Rhizophlyctis rosea]|uniref:AB hydrolase-1 domain-containing protein n=1 Tax=Rhizophlyctis rosea TaxID=64517 RepID=A0AAD5WYQ9_9FUNG|nr:hypothetical protein HK097_000642 [Rhizophlyctis rosea]
MRSLSISQQLVSRRAIGAHLTHRPLHRFLSTASLAFDHYPPKTTNTSSTPLVICHGLFGSKQNWRSISKTLAQRLHKDVYALDMRNHGESSHHPEHNYAAMAKDVTDFLDSKGINQADLMGHSMGGKVVMTLALSSPSRLSSLTIVDMAPSNTYANSSYQSYIQAMKEIESTGVTKVPEADKILAKRIPDISLRQFLLTNLKHVPSSPALKFRINLTALGEHLEEIWKWNPPPGAQYTGKTLFIAGTKSDHVPKSVYPKIMEYFPNAEIELVNAGHWWVNLERL